MNIFIYGCLALLIALVIALLTGPSIIARLKKASFGQQIREEGPAWHKKKSGTPTMGAFIFMSGLIPAAIIITALSGAFDNTGTVVLLTALLFGAVGFCDDYIKVIKKRNLGLTAGKKFLSQAIISVAFSVLLYGENGGVINALGRNLDLSFFVIIFNTFVMLATVNAVNLTDGIDGLAGSTAVCSMAFFAFAAYKLGFDMLLIVLMAVIGGVLGFLFYNKYPAKVFMGDTGSMFLGGMVVALSFGIERPVLLLLIGITYLSEALSDVIQVAYYKRTKKRIFKMAPLHHHFEMCGWSEQKIVLVFSGVTALGSLAALLPIIFNK